MVYVHSHGRQQNLEELTVMLQAGAIEIVGQNLVDMANDRGGRDNITVLLVDAV